VIWRISIVRAASFGFRPHDRSQQAGRTKPRWSIFRQRQSAVRASRQLGIRMDCHIRVLRKRIGTLPRKRKVSMRNGNSGKTQLSFNYASAELADSPTQRGCGNTVKQRKCLRTASNSRPVHSTRIQARTTRLNYFWLQSEILRKCLLRRFMQRLLIL
jgi:hypothetical protein